MDRYMNEILKRDLSKARTTAPKEALVKARDELVKVMPEDGLGDGATEKLLFDTIIPALAGGHSGPRYFGFVTGGRTDISLLADHIVGNYDNNVQVHLPNDTISTYVESIALDLVLDLIQVDRSIYPSKTITTGATSSNILGLALGRQAVISRIKSISSSNSSSKSIPPSSSQSHAAANGTANGSTDVTSKEEKTTDSMTSYSVSEHGFGGVEIDILCVEAHASIKKAASITGIGRSRVIGLPKNESKGGGNGNNDYDEGRDLVAFDLVELENRLKIAQREGRGVIVCPAYGEVNTGAFTPDMPIIRQLCDQYNAWLHLDAAFGGFGVLHPDFTEELKIGLSLADSLTLDGHKWLNVPYDCGLFYTRHPEVHQAVCGPGADAPAYLATSSTSNIPSPLNVRLENSSRFRGLPLYASLVSYGVSGYTSIIRRDIEFARRLERWLRNNEDYDILTPSTSATSSFKVLNIVLFAPNDRCPVEEFRNYDNGGTKMTEEINKSGEMYVTATKWKGRSAARLAVSNHLTGLDGDGDRDFEIVTGTLRAIMGRK